jgi:nucleotide-binding universal stress UspA family protein
VGKSSIFDIIPDIQEKTRDALQNMIKDTPGPDVEVAYHVAEGQAATEIVKFAESHHSDLIVISTHGLTGLEHLLVGSVAEKVVRSAACPVFTVKPFGKSLSYSNKGKV